MTDALTAEEIYRSSGLSHLIDGLGGLTESALIPDPGDWAVENRYMPAEITEQYGKFDMSLVPQYAEPLACQHPDDPTTSTAWMGSVQSAKTTSLLENTVGFWLKYMLGSVAMFTSSKTMAKMKSSSSLDPLIDHAGLSSHLSPISSRMSRKTADTALYKEFMGGCKVLLTSYQSIADMKSLTFNCLIMDEWAEAPAEIKGQGATDDVISGRTVATQMYKKIYASTATNMDTCQIYKKFYEGDQRRFFVPCPICDAPQVLLLNNASRDYGLTFDRKINPETGAKVIDENSVRYICQHCKREFYEGQKKEICNRGVWKPTWKDSDYKPLNPNHRSYHGPAYISQFLSWNRICQDFVDTEFGKNLAKLKVFTNNYDAWPWAQVSKSYHWTKLKARAENYRLGDGPESFVGILYASVDVQEDRLEIGVGLIGRKMESYWVDYRVFYGETKNIYDSCWDNLYKFVHTQTYMVDGIECNIRRCAIDSNWDPKMKNGKRNWKTKDHTVYQFVAQDPEKFIAIKGGKEKTTVGMVTQKRVHNAAVTHYYEVAVSKIKEYVFAHIDQNSGPYTVHVPRYEQPKGGMDINVEIPDSWYKMFVSERYQEITPNVFGWKKLTDRNEVWDLTIYWTALAYFEGLDSWTTESWDIFENDFHNG